MTTNKEFTKDIGEFKKGLSTKQVVLICSGGLFAIAIIVAFCIMLSPFGQYNLGISALNHGKYESAVKHLTSAGAYRDAQLHLQEATLALNYQQAQAAFASEDYATAVEKYSQVPGYLDADNQIVLAQTCLHYQLGDSFFANGEYLQASEEFSMIPEYQDSADRQLASYYQYAIQLESSGEYLSSAEYYRLACDYSDSDEHIYNCGINLFEAGNYADASTVFGYTDYADSAQWMYYSSGYERYESGRYSAATEFFRGANGLNDAAELRIETAYLAGVDKMESSDYDDASDYFSIASGYEDADYRRDCCELMIAEDLYDDGKLNAAKEAFLALPYDLEYSGISVSQRLEILEQYSDYVNICGEWNSTHSYIESACYFTYSFENWYLDYENGGETLSIYCIINDDGSVTISGTIRYDIFTGYSSIRDYMAYYWSSRNYHFTINNASLGESWEIRSTATLSYSNGAFHLRDFDSDTPFSGCREEYTTEVTYGSLFEYHLH